jgi:two-component system NarL family sensor kinase
MKTCIFIAFLLVFTACTNLNEEKIDIQQNTADSTKIAEFFNRALVSPDSSYFYVNKAKAVANHNGSVACQSAFLFSRGKAYLNAGKLDSVLIIADQGLAMKFAEKDSVYIGKFYNLKGNVAGFQRHLFTSLDYYLKAEKLFESVKDFNALAGIYSNIANNYFSLKDYSSALSYSKKAIKLLDYVTDPRFKVNILTTYAIALNKTGNSKKALTIEFVADSLSKKGDDYLAKMSTKIGFAEIYKSLKQFDKSQYYYNECISLSKLTGVKHFELMSKIGLLSIHEELGDYKAIVDSSDSLFNLAEQLNNIDVLHTSKRIVGNAYSNLKDYKNAYRFLNESYTLQTETAGVENQKNINELRLKFETEKKKKMILQQRFQLSNQQKNLRDIQLISITLFLVLLIVTITVFYKKRLDKQQQILAELKTLKEINDALQKGEEKERKRIAFDVHDGISAMLTGISYKLSSEHSDKEEILQLLKTLQEDSRNIAHNLMPIDFDKTTLMQAIERLCLQLTSEKVDIVFLTSISKTEINPQKCLIFYRLVQELINNALKYSMCKTIFIKLDQITNYLHISVEDDGIGIEKSIQENGLISIKERIRSLNGSIVILSNQLDGTNFQIKIKNE